MTYYYKHRKRKREAEKNCPSQQNDIRQFGMSFMTSSWEMQRAPFLQPHSLHGLIWVDTNYYLLSQNMTII